MGSFRDLEAFQKSRELAVAIYQATANFPRCEMFGMTQQLRRAAVSVVSNIAEGKGRWSKRDQLNFYYIARGSLLEIEAQLLISGDLEYLQPQALDGLFAATKEVARKLNGLIRTLKPEG